MEEQAHEAVASLITCSRFPGCMDNGKLLGDLLPERVSRPMSIWASADDYFVKAAHIVALCSH